MDEWTGRQRPPDARVASPAVALPSQVGVPPLPAWLVPRPRLTDRLARGVLGPLTVVVGPVGAGKSALAVEWAHTHKPPGPVAWVTCDGAEEEPDVFWSRVPTALREAGVDLPPFPDVLQPETELPGAVVREAVARETGVRAASVRDAVVREAAAREEAVRDAVVREAAVREAVVREAPAGDEDVPHGDPEGDPGAERPLLVASLAAALAARKEPVVLVLDDFQPETGSPVARGTARLLRHAGPVLRLVVLSRRDPPLHLHRHRLAGELTELRTADLAFDDRETAALLAQHGVEVSRSAVSTLRERADGWAAGLRLAAMSMAEHPHPERFVAQFAGDDEAVVSYLVEEVLDGQSPEMRRLLVATSVLDHLNAELATELAGKEAGAQFPALVEHNSFLQYAGRGWYRCHRMFTDVLRVRLRHEAPDLIPGLHRRAAVWLGEQGLLAEAVRHALSAGDRRYAGRLVVHQLAIGDVLALTDARLPGELMRPPLADTLPPAQSPDAECALVAAAVALRRGEEPVCAEALELADKLLAELPPDESDRIARCRLTHAVIRMARDRCRDPQAARLAAADAEQLFARMPHGLPAGRPELKALALSIRGRAELREGTLKAAEASLTAGLKAAGTAGSGVLRRECLAELALLEVLRGRFRVADELAGHALRAPRPAGSPDDPSPAALHVVRAWVCLARYESARARNELALARSALRVAPDPFVAGVGSLVAQLLCALEGGAPPSPEAVAALPDSADWLAEDLRRPVRQACAASVCAARVHTLRASGTDGRALPPGTGEQDDRPPVEQLSAREYDVLRRLAQMMTTEEIAADLYLSVNTVKTHLKGVYRKLAVTRRSAAVRRARELELL
ncbi:LuxR C-terminal-related transcriptional regulator [Streptomyces sp. NPDC050788]|uniref:LuxR C-terminal-related transcriptional regulator n=1 Tax=Streptomyces sp. NPDC050788 TaxID=3155041 RepID=UPI00341DE382